MKQEKTGNSDKKIIRLIYKPRVCILIGLFTNLCLTVFKFFAGIFGFSQAMVADALHSFSDALTSAVAYIGVRIGRKPADEDHPYGHGNAETIAAGLVSFIIFGIGVYVGVSAILVIVQKKFKLPLNVAVWAAVISIIVKEILFRYTLKVGKVSNSPAVEADAWHHRSDAYSSVAALAGIVGAKISFLYLDPLAGVIVSALIIGIALRLIRSNIGIIMDERPNLAFINNVKDIAHKIEGVKKIDNVKIHRRGSNFTVDIEIAVDGSMSVDEGHRIANNLRDRLFKDIRNIREVMVHINPY